MSDLVTRTVPCPRCGGAGTIESAERKPRFLTGVHAETLGLLASMGGERYAGELAKLLHCTDRAMANRLAVLEERGYLVSRWCGKRKLYSLAQLARMR